MKNKIYLLCGMMLLISLLPMISGDGWDISNAVYSQSFHLPFNYPVGLFFNPDGTILFSCNSDASSVSEFSLSTAWDISTATYVQSVIPFFSYISDVDFNPSGTKMYVTRTGIYSSIHEFNLSTAWDISTATFVQVVGEGIVRSTDIFFNPDGTKLWLLDYMQFDVYNDAVLKEFELSTAWDISTMIYVQNLSLYNRASPQGVVFSPDGHKVFIVYQEPDIVEMFELSTAWDISTNISSSTFPTIDGASSGIAFSSGGEKMYVVGFGYDNVDEFYTGSAVCDNDFNCEAEQGETYLNCPNDCASPEAEEIPNTTTATGGMTLPTQLVDTENFNQGLLPEIYYGTLGFFSSVLSPTIVLVFVIFFALIMITIGMIIKKIAQKVGDMGR